MYSFESAGKNPVKAKHKKTKVLKNTVINFNPVKGYISGRILNTISTMFSLYLL